MLPPFTTPALPALLAVPSLTCSVKACPVSHSLCSELLTLQVVAIRLPPMQPFTLVDCIQMQTSLLAVSERCLLSNLHEQLTLTILYCILYFHARVIRPCINCPSSRST